MPDYIINELAFSDLTDAEIADIEALTLNSKGNVDFNILVPLPDRLRGEWKDGDMREVISFWGTKWNAQGNPPFKMVKKPGDGRLILRFLTANNKPWHWIMALIARTRKPVQYTWCWGGKFGWQSTFDHRSTDPITEREIEGDKALLKRMKKLYRKATAINETTPSPQVDEKASPAESSSNHPGDLEKRIDELAWEFTKAITACPHHINDDEVILRYMPKSEGHNALNQLSRRIKDILSTNPAFSS
jgi:hypothetical protein